MRFPSDSSTESSDDTRRRLAQLMQKRSAAGIGHVGGIRKPGLHRRPGERYARAVESMTARRLAQAKYRRIGMPVCTRRGRAKPFSAQAGRKILRCSLC